MKFAKLIHNPSAGEGQMDKDDLISLVHSAGFGCSYSSTKKKGWEKIESRETDFIILAGGDGTIRRVAESLLKQKIIDRKFPIGVLPMGTANNIAKTLGLLGSDPRQLINSWKEQTATKFDVGTIFGMKGAHFFLESFGFGVLPELMKRMEKEPAENQETPEQSLQTALTITREIVEKARARYCKITIDGVEHKGNYLLVEIMNTASIGPQLRLAPFADPSDGHFDVVMIADKQRDDFIDYIDCLKNGKDEHTFFELLRAHKLQIYWDGGKAHVDDEIVKIESEQSIEVELRHEVLEFLIPENGDH